MLREVILDTLIDSARLLPFLFVAYLAIELLEHYAGDRTDRLMQRAGRYGPGRGAGRRRSPVRVFDGGGEFIRWRRCLLGDAPRRIPLHVGRDAAGYDLPAGAGGADFENPWL